MIDWTKADNREWRTNCWGQIFAEGVEDSIGGFASELDAQKAVTLNNYLLAQERRPELIIGNVTIQGKSLWFVGNEDNETVLSSEHDTLLAAMAEFVRLDKEMPR